jgi:hypothetical protein
MRFGSWIYNSNELSLDYFEGMKHVDLNDYVASGMWDIVEAPAHIEFKNYTGSKKTKAQIVYKIKMKRKTLFYTINLIIPTFLISCLSICIFYLPCDESGSGEKITLSLSILFALLVYFLLLTKRLPPTSVVVPLISKYLLFIFIMNVLSVFNTCLVISCYYKQPNVNLIHPWLRLIFIEILPKILFMQRPINSKRDKMFHDIVKTREKQDHDSLSIRYNSYNKFYNEKFQDSILIDYLKEQNHDYKVRNNQIVVESIKYMSYLTCNRRRVELVRFFFVFFNFLLN